MSRITRFCPITKQYEECFRCVNEYCRKRVTFAEDRPDDDEYH